MATKQPDKARPRRLSSKSNAAKPYTPDPIQIAMGIEQGELASDVLRRQSHLIDAQAREIHFNHIWHLILRGIAAALTGLFLLGLIAMVWEAANDESLVIDAFTAPPEFTERGLSGEVIAGKMQDELNALDSETATARSPRSYANAWEGDIRVEVPEAKISLGELRRTIHEWLGDATHISGSAYLEAGQARLEARVNGKSFAVTGGKEAINPLIKQLALAVFADTQPQRYAVKLLFVEGLDPDAFAILGRLAQSKRLVDRYWANATLARFHPDTRTAQFHALQAIAEKKKGQWGWETLAEAEFNLGRLQASVDAGAKLDSLMASGPDSDLSEYGWERVHNEGIIHRALLFGNLAQTKRAAALLEANPLLINKSVWPFTRSSLGVLLHEHATVDTKGYVTVANQPNRLGSRYVTPIHYLAAQQVGNWTEIAGQDAAIRRILPQRGNLMPLLAEAYAHLGKNAEADAIITALPTDHYERWRTCGRIAALRKDWAAGERCFREAIRQAPSIPRGYLDYGTMLAAKGDLVGAARQIALAHEKGPKWADPLKAWGDLLLRQGRKNDAREKYEAALEHAPAWPELKATLRQLGK